MQVLGTNPQRDIETFYYDPYVLAAFQKYVKAVVLRTNTITGVQYRDEPAIFAWELMNEPETKDWYEVDRGA